MPEKISFCKFASSLSRLVSARSSWRRFTGEEEKAEKHVAAFAAALNVQAAKPSR
jgi:hypothetical protein